MQDEVNEKTIALYIKTGKLTPDAPKGNESHTVKGKKANRCLLPALHRRVFPFSVP